MAAGGGVRVEEGGEDVRLGPAHGLEHEGPGLVVPAAPRLDPDGDQGGLEGRLDGPVVAHGGPGHVQARQGVAADHAATPAAAKVSAAMAGEHVMPRPPGPVTIHTDGSTSSRRHTAPSRHWA